MELPFHLPKTLKQGIQVALASQELRGVHEKDIITLIKIDRNSTSAVLAAFINGNFSATLNLHDNRQRGKVSRILNILQSCARDLQPLIDRFSSIVGFWVKLCNFLIQIVLTNFAPEARVYDLVHLVSRIIHLCNSDLSRCTQQKQESQASTGSISRLIIFYHVSELLLHRKHLPRFLLKRIIAQFESCFTELERSLTHLEKALTRPVLRNASQTSTSTSGTSSSAAALQRGLPATVSRAYVDTSVTSGSGAVFGDVYGTVVYNISHPQSQPTPEQWMERYQMIEPSDCRSPDRHALPRDVVSPRSFLYKDQDSEGGEQSSSTTPISFLEQYKAPRVRLLPNTCGLLMQTSRWTQWIRGRQDTILLITGKPGTGKSANIARILQHFTATGPTVLSHCFSATQENVHKVVQNFYTSLVVQLYEATCATSSKTQADNILEHFGRLYEDISRCPKKILLAIINGFISLAKPALLVVDGIEQCGNQPQQREVARFLTALVESERLPVVATCRRINLFLRNRVTILELTPELTAQDLVCLVEHYIATKSIWSGPQKQLLRRKIRQLIVDHSQGNFLCATILIELISRCHCFNEMKESIQKLGVTGNSEPSRYYDHLNTEVEASLSVAQRRQRQEVLYMILAAKSSVHIETLDNFLCINEDGEHNEEESSIEIRTRFEVLGRSFLHISEDGQIEFCYPAIREYFLARLTLADANLYLARKCVAILRAQQYRQPAAPRDLLIRHILKGTKYGLPPDRPIPQFTPIYKYAAEHFHEHVVLVPKPPQDLVVKLGGLIRGIEFVTWSESLWELNPGGGFSKTARVFRALRVWAETLPNEDQEDIAIESFFEVPHHSLALRLEEETCQVNQYLPSIRVGEYFNAVGQTNADWRKAFEAKKLVVAGLSKLMGEKARLVLKQRASLYVEYLVQKKFTVAAEKLFDLHKIQTQILESSKEDAHITAWMLGMAYLAVGKLESAQALINDAKDKVSQLFGEQYRLFLLLVFIEGQRLELSRKLSEAAARYRAVVDTLTKLLGKENGFTLMAMTALGSVLRKQHQYVESEDLLTAGWGGRETLLGGNNVVTVDAALNLALLHRDSANYADCLEVLQSIQSSSTFSEDFERHCQLVHLQSLVAFENGEYAQPKTAIIDLIEKASGKERDLNNRELLWARLDLAEIMCQHGDTDEALTLFTDLVCSSKIENDDLRSEPESRQQLQTAKKALCLVREAKVAEAQALLTQNHLRWVRDADFYFLIIGGPLMDTSLIRPISKSLGYVQVQKP